MRAIDVRLSGKYIVTGPILGLEVLCFMTFLSVVRKYAIMKKLMITALVILCGFLSNAQTGNLYKSSMVFPVDFKVDDSIHFAKIALLAFRFSGYYKIRGG